MKNRIISVLCVLAMLLAMMCGAVSASEDIVLIGEAISVGAGWQTVAQIYSTNWGGTVASDFITEGGKLTVIVSGENLYSAHVVMLGNTNGWAQVDKESVTFTDNGDGTYAAVFTYEDLAGVYGAAPSDVNAYYMYVNSDEAGTGATVHSAVWSAGEAVPEETTPEESKPEVTWMLDDEGVLTISGNGAIVIDEFEGAPWDGMITKVIIQEGITEIGDFAFSGCDLMKEIAIPDTVTKIGSYAFCGCSSLDSVNIPDSVTRIGDYSFYECSSLNEVILPQYLREIDDYTFYGCNNLNYISIPDSVCTIGKGAFACSGLTAVELSDNITMIDWYAFSNTMLTSITLPAGIISEEFNINAFDGCMQLVEIKVDENNCSFFSDSYGVLYADSRCLWAPKNLSGSYEVVEGTETIERYAFSGCTELSNLVLPYSLEMIYAGIIRGCTSLKHIHIPASVRYIFHAFSDCSSLEAITVDEDNSWYRSDECGILYSKDETELIQVPGGYVGDYVIPDGVESISQDAFNGCVALTSIYISESVSDLDTYCFGGNTALGAIHIDANNPTYSSDEEGIVYNKEKTRLIIVPEAYSGDIYFPDTIRTIDSYAFLGKNRIKNIYIPASADDVSVPADEVLEGIWVDSENQTYSSDERGALLSKDGTELYQVPGGTAGEYCIPDGIEIIDYGAFRSCTKVTKVIVPTIGCGFLGCSTFQECQALESLVFTGDAPELDYGRLATPHTVTAYYPADNATWTETIRESFGYSITWVKLYEIQEGKNAVVDLSTDSSLNIVIDADMSCFDCLIIDDEIVHCDNYTVKSGSTIVSLYIEFLRALKQGSHTVRAVFKDGVAETQITLNCTHTKITEVMEKLPSCTENGHQMHLVCDNCGAIMDVEGDELASVEQIILPATGHSYSEKNTPPTCTKQGYTTHICHCGVSYIDSYVPTLGHTEVVDKAVDATCTAIGLTEGKHCSVCNEVLVAQTVVPAKGHSYSENVTASTCTEQGFTTHICACGDSYTDTYTDALGHDFGDWVTVKEPSYLENGLKERRCSRCDVFESEEIPNNPFTDVGDGNRFKTAILWAYYNDITKGKTATTFEPNTTVNRAQAVTFLWRAAGSPEPELTENPFTDVGEGAYYYKAVMWAVENKITSGTTTSTFSPDKLCTRGHIAMFLYNYAGKPDVALQDDRFEDVTSNNRYYKAVMWAIQEEITSGKTENSFGLHQECTRAHVVTFLYKLLEEKK